MAKETAATICPTSVKPCICLAICQERKLCARLHHSPIDLMLADYKPITHFVGFRGEEYHSAIRVFGLPDVIHYVWDERAQREIAPLDIVVFAKYGPDWKPSPYNYDDSNENDDPAAIEHRMK